MYLAVATTILFALINLVLGIKPIDGNTDINYCYRKTGRNIKVENLTWTPGTPNTLEFAGQLLRGEVRDLATCQYSGYYGSTLLFRENVLFCGLPAIQCPVAINSTFLVSIPTPAVRPSLVRGLRIALNCVDARMAELLCLKGFVYIGGTSVYRDGDELSYMVQAWR